MEDKQTGQQIEDNDDFRMQARKLGNSIPQCQHCYCGRSEVNGKMHMVCCMCGNRTLVNPISF